MTFTQKIEDAIAHAKCARNVSLEGEAKAEFTLAIRALEDAGMRFNRGVATGEGILKSVDFEAA